MFEGWLDVDKRGLQFVGLDLEYTPCGRAQTVSVMQVAMRNHVLVYHYCRGLKFFPHLREFLQKKQITFVSVDKRRDNDMFRIVAIYITPEYHVDIQDLFKIKEKGDRAGMGALEVAIIDDSYKNMKKFTDLMHQQLHLPLSPEHLRYVAIDGYVCYDMYKRILDMKEGLGLGH
jgi:hypothetical protein